MTAVTHIHGAEGHAFLNIAGAATTAVKGKPGTLHRVVFNKRVAAGVVTIYDNASAASGTKVGTITNAGTLLSDAPVTVEYGGVNMSNGIVVVTSAADDITVVYD